MATNDSFHTMDQSGIEALVVDSVKSVLNRNSVELSDDFYDLGADSLDTVALLDILAKETGRFLTVDVIFGSRSISDIALNIASTNIGKSQAG
ncbi:phosphopantetheine binding protein [Arthrobacter sp. AG258]|uniref:acyl carrier protein n=1 Tax=Arthrobacter sp. AG258 TaxID=2183899 RepID=UPI001061621E|nr:acyl carrier protein [Arthrobacter sp. AG258]TDT81849.1 phosphopantetheine binding protein [Arthrobacter sp. AG258]